MSKYVVYANIISLFLSSIVKVVLILNEAPLIAFAWVVLFDSLILACGFVYFYIENSQSKIQKLKFYKSTAIKLLKDSWPLILSGVAISIALRIDQVMIKEYMDFTNVGFYATGVRLAEIFVFIPMMISQSIFPKIISMNFKEERKSLIMLIRGIFFPLIGLALVINLTSEFIVITLFGKEFLKSYIVLDILIWTIPITYLGIITNKLLLKENNQKIIFQKQVSLTIINIFLNIYMIPIYGILGAALATLVADIIINILFDIVYLKSRWIFYLKLEALFFIKTEKEQF